MQKQQFESVIANNEAFLQKHKDDLQANIFSGRKKDHVLVLMLKVNDKLAGETLIGMLNALGKNSREQKGLYLTSYGNQLDLEKNLQLRQSLFLNLFLTASGLEKLGCKDESWQPVIEHLRMHGQDLESINNAYGDVHKDPKVDAVLLLAHEVEDALIRVKRQLVSDIFPRIDVECVFEETAEVLRESTNDYRRGRAIEHFGYADGASNPCITSRELAKVKSRNYWDPVASYEEFVLPEPQTSEEQQSYGSYLVLRKFEQHLDKFREATEELSKKWKVKPDEAGARMFGRRKDGSALEADPLEPDKDINDFHYGGGKCPMFSHARKMNPRNQPNSNELPKAYSSPNPIMRRGVTFGKREQVYGRVVRDRSPRGPVGMLFMSFQKDINQFQTILKQGETGERDPFLGRKARIGKAMAPDPKDPLDGFGGFVSLMGGLNLYAPSISFFEKLQPSQIV